MYPNNNRETYEKTRQLLQSKNPDLALVPGFLRVDVPIRSNKTTYDFNLADGIASSDLSKVRNVERRLRKQDSFVATQLGLFIAPEANTVNEGSGILLTYPDDGALNTAEGTAGDISTTDWQVFYNGSLGLQVGQQLVVDAIDNRQFMHIGTTQRGVGPTSGSNLPNYSEVGQNNGFIHLEPNLRFSGENSNIFKLNVPNYSGIKLQATKTGWEIFAVLMLRGFLITNGSKLFSTQK